MFWRMDMACQREMTKVTKDLRVYTCMFGFISNVFSHIM